MKLAFYGGGDSEDNRSLDEILLNMVNRESPIVTYIPSCSYDSEVYFRDFVEQYEPFGITKFYHFPIDLRFDQTLLESVLESDIIHLSGGNTYYFLKYLKKNNMMGRLKDFVRKGGILTGLSAGAILMTPDIQTAGFPEFDRDENDVKVRNLSSLGLVPFFFFPHYRNSRRYDKELLKFSRKENKPVYACPDGSGMVIDHDITTLVGKVYCFYQGKKILLRK